MVLISQSEVLEFLEKNKRKWFTSRQISKELGISIGSCTNNIFRLIKHQLIRRRESGKRYCFEYSCGKDEEY